MTGARLPNMHATCVVIAERGILIVGPSGSGKSILAMTLLAEAKRRNKFAACAGDDQVFLETANGRLIAHAPQPTFGKMEMHGAGIVAVASIPSAVVDLVAELAAPEQIERMPSSREITVEGVTLPLLKVPQRQAPLVSAMLLQILDGESICG